MLECSKKWYNYTPMVVVKAKEKKEPKDKTGKVRKLKRKSTTAKRVPPAGALVEELVVAEFTGLPLAGIMGKNRFEEFVTARHIIWHFLYKFPDLTQKIIGARYGVHHSTVFNGLIKVESMMLYKWYRERLAKIETLIAIKNGK